MKGTSLLLIRSDPAKSTSRNLEQDPVPRSIWMVYTQWDREEHLLHWVDAMNRFFWASLSSWSTCSGLLTWTSTSLSTVMPVVRRGRVCTFLRSFLEPELAGVVDRSQQVVDFVVVDLQEGDFDSESQFGSGTYSDARWIWSGFGWSCVDCAFKFRCLMMYSIERLSSPL